MRNVLRVGLAVFLLTGCPGSTDATQDIGVLPPQPDYGPQPDFPAPPPPPPNPCQFDDGQSCQGGAACPKGLQPIIQPEDDKCYCRPPCNPDVDQSTQCGGYQCGRVCVAMTDAQGVPRPGVGVCLPDPGQSEGNACSPAACQQRLHCIGPDDISFCRRSCEKQEDCPGFKMVCGEVIGEETLVCVPGEHPGGPVAGEDCSGLDVYCSKGFLCDPVSTKCLVACNTDAGDSCGAVGTCTKLEDPSRSMTIGWGCK